MERARFQYLARRAEPPKPLLSNVVRAFVAGGLISAVGQVVLGFFVGRGMSPEKAVSPTAVVMVFLGSLFTALGLYDRLAKWAGMGAALPITGFANSMVAPAMEFRTEGLVAGVGARIFQVAGPVLLYGLGSSFVVGMLVWIGLLLRYR